jgi:hypothetical protein
MEECTYFWGVNTSWGINMVESKRHINKEDNQAPKPTLFMPKDHFSKLAYSLCCHRLIKTC